MNRRFYQSQHHVYLLGNPNLGYFKIGMSHDADMRLKNFNLPFDIAVLKVVRVPDRFKARTLEIALHGFYTGRGLHLRGEWFKNINVREFTSVCKNLAKDLA